MLVTPIILCNLIVSFIAACFPAIVYCFLAENNVGETLRAPPAQTTSRGDLIQGDRDPIITSSQREDAANG